MQDSHDVPVRVASSTITWANRWDHFLARCGVNRSGHRVEPGLYALGHPTPDSPVFVTANYTLSFDALRSALAGIDGYILVLDTQGINVWCAAGKGTFGTDELVRRIGAARLSEVVNRRQLILPQLGAAGVSAHEVRRRSGFNVEYGPVRAADLPEYLRNHQATEEMRRIRFALADRLILIPVEVVHMFVPTLFVTIVLYATSGWLAASSAVAAILAGVVLFPIFLPLLPTRDFSSKGFILGGVVALPFVLATFHNSATMPLWFRLSNALVFLLALPPVTAFLSLNFTGATPITSRSGVKREIFTYIPIMAWMFGIGIVLTVGVRLFQMLGGT